MTAPDYRRAIAEFIRANAKPPDKFGHQPRLYALARELAEGQPFDDDVLFAATWMHDLGVFVGHRPEEPDELARWDNVAYVLRQAPEVLERLGFPAGKIPAVLEAIRTHQAAQRPTSFEGTLMRDADILEQLGAVGILRTVSKVGRDTRFIWFGDALAVLRHNATELPAQLELASSRRLAKERVEVMTVFLDAAEADLGDSELDTSL